MKNVHFQTTGKQVEVVVKTSACVVALGFALCSACSPFSKFEGSPDDNNTLPPPKVDVTPEFPLTNDNLICTTTPPTTKADTQSITYYYAWFKNDSLQPNLTTKVVNASYTSKGDVWKCVVITSDGTDNGSSAFDEVTIFNTPPTAPAAHITPDTPTSDDNLVCSMTQLGSDTDSDTIVYAYQWYENGVLQPNLLTDTVDAGYTSAGSIWNCVVIAYDGTASTAGTSDQVTVVSDSGNPSPDPSPSDPDPSDPSPSDPDPSNNAPSAPVVSVTPGTPATTDNLACSITTPSTDADGDSITYTYRWYKNNVLQSGLTTNTLAASYTTKGEVWKCVVTASDGTAGTSGTSNQVTIANSTPTAPVVHVTPDQPVGSDNLTCSITTASTDADGDAITYTYQWYKNGVPQPGLTSNSIDSGYTTQGEVWKCVVTASDGEAVSADAFDEVGIVSEGTRSTYFECSFSEEGPEGFKEDQAWAEKEPCGYPCEKGVWHNMAVGPYVPTGGTLSIVRDPVDTARYCLKAALTASGTRPLSAAQHTKLYEVQAWEDYYEPFNGAYYYAEYYFPSSMEVISWRNIMQWGEKGGIGYPICSISLYANTVVWTNKEPHNMTDATSVAIMNLADLPRDRWVPIQVYLEEGSGYQIPDSKAKIWIDGVLRMDRDDVSIHKSGEENYPNWMWGIGNYGSASEAQGQYLLVRNVEVSSAKI